MSLGQQYMRMIRDMDPLEQLCRTVEATVHEEGWDQRPHFYAISLVGDYKTADMEEINREDATPGGLIVVEIELPEFCYEDPAGGVMSFIRLIAEDATQHGLERSREVAKILDHMIPPNFFGFGQIYEAWAISGDSKEEIREWSESRMIHMHPDRVELRGMHVATRDGRFASLGRKRGEAPEYIEHDPTDEKLVMEGRVPDSIRMMTSFLVEFDEWRESIVADMESSEDS